MRPTDEAARSATLVLESLDAELVDSAKPVDSQFAHNPSTKETEYETSTALVGNLNLPKVHIQATPFLDALDNLKSASDRVCDLAGRETEPAGPVEQNTKTEIAALRLQLREESLKARVVALREMEEAWRAKIELIQNQVRAREVQLRVRESNLARLATKVYGVIGRLNETEAEAQRKTEQLESEIAGLRQQLQERDERLAAKKATPELAEALKENIKELEQQLQAAEQKLQSCESELKTKENLIQAAAAKEAELGKLIARLSSECERLASGARSKSPVASQLEKKQERSLTDSPVWKKIVGRIQEEPV
jgi:chromosome segregation ATPase